MDFLQNLPDNGCSSQATETADDVYYHPYIAFHDTKPERYCKVAKMNHFERSIVLRKELNKMQRQERIKRDNCQQKQKRKRCRKRKRTEMQSKGIIVNKSNKERGAENEREQ